MPMKIVVSRAHHSIILLTIKNVFAIRQNCLLSLGCYTIINIKSLLILSLIHIQMCIRDRCYIELKDKHVLIRQYSKFFHTCIQGVCRIFYWHFVCAIIQGRTLTQFLASSRAAVTMRFFLTHHQKVTNFSLTHQCINKHPVAGQDQVWTGSIAVRFRGLLL